MLEVGSQLRDDVMDVHQTGLGANPVDDWELVNRESCHRMKNTLMLLAASARKEFTRGKIDDLATSIDRFERRIAAFGRLYQLLSSNEDVEPISVPNFFGAICEALSETILEPAEICCEVAIEDGKLPATQAHRLALIVSELVTNAAKHAFTGRKEGLIRVGALNRNRCWCFTVTDNGRGTIGSLQGAGRTIVKGLARSIGARLHYQSGRDGTRATIVIPARV